jgi:hypothetical protein
MKPVPWATLGTHASLNKHENMALGDRGPVYDIDRTVWTADVNAVLPWDQRIYAFYGDGTIDDFIEAQPYRFDYGGWGFWMLKTLLYKEIELGVRFDSFTTEFNQDGNETTEKNWTFGLNYFPENSLRLQLNYTDKETANDYEPDIDDNILYFNFQFLFDTVIVR